VAAPNRERNSSRSGLGGLLIVDAFSVGRSGRTALPVARRHGDSPASPCGSGDEHPDRNKPSGNSAGRESPSRVKGRSRRGGDHGVPLAGGSLGDLQVLHNDRSTWPAPTTRRCRMVSVRRHAVPSGIGDARPYRPVAGRAGAVVLVRTALLRRVR
jgi:hypothetical protein